MSNWKSDPLYREIFEEIRALWDQVDESVRPMLYRVEDRSRLNDESSTTEVWVYDDEGFRSVPMLRAETHNPGPTTNGFDRFGRVWFNVDRRVSKLMLAYRLGPKIKGEIAYDIEKDGATVFLMADTGSLTI